MLDVSPISNMRRANKWMTLAVLTSVYVMGELSHFLLGIVTRPMSQELEYGDKGCLSNPDSHGNVEAENIDCYTSNSSQSCTDLGELTSSNTSACHWDYSGLGLEYQILAGPSFIFVFTISGVLIGTVLDRWNRHVVVTVCLAVLTVATILMGAAKYYWHLVVLRMIIGAGESSFAPGCSSMISDMFPKAEQGLAMGIFNWGIYFGYGLSFCIGNFVTLADVAGMGWRFSYYISGAFGILVTLIMLIIVREPPRGGAYTNSSSKSYELPQQNSNMYEMPEESKLNRGKNGKISNRKGSLESNGSEHENNGFENNMINGNHSNGNYSKNSQDVPSLYSESLNTLDTVGDSSVKGLKVDQSEEKSSICCGDSGIFAAFKVLLSPPLALMTIAACVRHTAGFTWAYNTQLYFSTYYPSYNLGYWITGCSIIGGTLGVAIGGLVSDKLVKKIGIKARMVVLGGSQLIATPFAAGVLFLSPPYAFYSLLLSYLFAEMWFGVVFAVLLELVPAKTQSTSIAFFLFIINNVGGNAPVLISPLRNALSYRTALAIMYPGNYLLSAILFFLTTFLL